MLSRSSFRHKEQNFCCRHDFVVVETIDFYADEDAELPPPMSQRDVILLNKAQQLEDEEEEEAAAAEGEAGKQKVGCFYLPMGTLVAVTSAKSIADVLPFTAHSVLLDLLYPGLLHWMVGSCFQPSC